MPGSILSVLLSGFGFAALMFSVRTNADSDGAVLLDGLRRLPELAPILLAEGSPILWGLGGLALCAAALAPFWLRRWWMKRKPAAAKLGSRSLWVPTLGALLLTLGGVALASALGTPATMRFVPPQVQVMRALFQGSAVENRGPRFAGGEMLRGEPASQPNVIVIILESTRASATSLHSDHETTPFLTELGTTRGRHAEQGYATVTHTSKGVTSALCGVVPRPSSAVGSIAEAGPGGLARPCLAKLLRSVGYSTAYFQSADKFFEGRDRLVGNMGFENYFGREDLDATGFEVTSYFGPEDDILIEPVATWAQEQSRPFFAAVLTVVPHSRYKVPRSIEKRHFVDDTKFNNYLNTVAYDDRFVKKLFERLEQDGSLDNTIFAIVGDHGEAFGEHGSFTHDLSIWEEGVRVPLIIGGPGTGTPGEAIEGLRQSTDILPSVLDAIGYGFEGSIYDGRSLMSDSPHDDVYVSCFYAERCDALVTPALKYISHFGKREPEAYDLRRDPLEESNLFDDLTASERADFEMRLERWRARTQEGFASSRQELLEHFVTHTRPEPELVLNTQYGDQALLVGIDGLNSVMTVGDPLDLRFHFESLARAEADARISVHLINDRGRRKNRLDHPPLYGEHPMTQWESGSFVTDPLHFGIPLSWKPGQYFLRVGIYHRSHRSLEISHRGAAELHNPSLIEIPFEVRARASAEPPAD